MKNRIKIMLLSVFTLLIMPLSAEKKLPEKIKSPNKNEVIVVGKISVKPKENMNFFAETRGLSEEEKKTPNTYFVPFTPLVSGKYDDEFLEFIMRNPSVIFTDGDFFCACYKMKSGSRNLKFEGATKYSFFGNDKTFIWLPFDFNIDVPKDVKAVYIGSFYYETSGNDFTLTNFKHVDEYELAQEALDKMSEKHFDLYRADLKENVDDRDVDAK